MNREFLFEYGREEERWSFSDSLSRWSWSVICCGVPGIPCSYCSCCKKTEEEPAAIIAVVDNNDTEILPVPTCERELPHRPHALRGRKSTPELMSAVRCALTQLQGQPASEKEAPEKEASEIEGHGKQALENEAPGKDALNKQVRDKETPKKIAIKKGQTG